MKSSTQLKALISNLSKEKNVEAEIILRNFMLERFLERVSLSAYKDSFILKGGLLIAAMVGIDTRNTMDMDVSIKGWTLTQAKISEIIEDILSIPTDDGVTLALQDIEGIRAGADYPGFRISIGASIERTRQVMKIDVATGDVITPGEIEYSYQLMFEDRKISILTYNLETILAEKFETIITRGVVNTRMRDFYDIYILTATQTFNQEVFEAALKKTAENRGTTEQMAEISDVIQLVISSSIMIDLWKRYQNKYIYAAEISWEMAMDALISLAQK